MSKISDTKWVVGPEDSWVDIGNFVESHGCNSIYIIGPVSDGIIFRNPGGPVLMVTNEDTLEFYGGKMHVIDSEGRHAG